MVKFNGIGGFFFKARSGCNARLICETSRPQRLQSGRLQTGGRLTVFAPFQHDTDCFGRAEQQWMINFRVDDLDAAVADLAAAGIPVERRPEWDYEVVRFCRVHDPEGNPVELWEPAKA